MLVDSEFKFIARNGTELSFYRTSSPPLTPATLEQINKDYKRKFNVRVRNAKHSTEYNCHGMTFVGKLGWFNDVRNILGSHGYKKIAQCVNFDIDDITIEHDISRGDVVVYFMGTDDNVTHTGTVWSVRRTLSRLEVTVLSKWGAHSEYFHRHDKVPIEYGKSIEIWTDRSIA